MDSVIDDVDNCVMASNTDQADADKDDIGDACEADTDMDGVIDDIDNCVMAANPNQADADMNGVGDLCDTTPLADADMDGIADEVDNCATKPNADQADADQDGVGDVCEGIIAEGGGCTCSQVSSTTGNAGGVMATLGVMLLAMFRRRRKA
jgi:hypothetical protein